MSGPGEFSAEDPLEFSKRRSPEASEGRGLATDCIVSQPPRPL